MHPEREQLIQKLQDRLSPRSRVFLQQLLAGELRGRLPARDRVRLHRIERQLWILLYVQHIEEAESLPLEIELHAIKELKKIGLYSAAKRRLSELFRRSQQNPIGHFLVSYEQYRLIMAHTGSLKEGRSALRQMQHSLRGLSRYFRWQGMQLRLMRLIQKKGGTYTLEGKAVLGQLERDSIWQLPPLDAQEVQLRTYCEGLIHLMKGNWDRSASCCDQLLRSRISGQNYEVSARLNRWLVGLYQGLDPEALAELIAPLAEGVQIEPSNQSILLYHILRTVWLYGTPNLMRAYYEALRPFCSGVPHAGELQVALAALARGSEKLEAAAMHYAHAQLPRFPFPTRFEAYLGSLFVAFERGEASIPFRRAYKFLLAYRDKSVEAELFIQFLRILAQRHVKVSRFHTFWREWQDLQEQHPSERFLWQITPIPFWGSCLLKRESLSYQLSTRPQNRPLFNTLGALIQTHLQSVILF